MRNGCRSCCVPLEGLSHEEAAHQLGWPLGTSRAGWCAGGNGWKDGLARAGSRRNTRIRGSSTILCPSVMPVPLVLAVATTRAAVQSCPGDASTAGTVSPSIALLLQRNWRPCFWRRSSLRRRGHGAGAAAILIGITMAGPLFGRGQELLPLAGTAGSRKVVARSAPGAPRRVASPGHAGPSP